MSPAKQNIKNPNQFQFLSSTSMAAAIIAAKPVSLSCVPRRAQLFRPPLPFKRPHFFNPTPKLPLQSTQSLHHHLSTHPQLLLPPNSTSTGVSNTSDKEISTLTSDEHPVKFVLWVVFWASVSLAFYAFSKDAKAATAVAASASADSIRASSFGLKIATALRSSGWPDELVVFALATLPVIELRGAIPVGYWMQLKPALLTVLSILGNMLPVPFIILYLKKFATFLAGENQAASRLLHILFERAKEKAGPVEEFQWLGLMLFVAVPFPGTGAWSGSIIASVLDMPFWTAVTANFFGVVIAGLLVNLLVNLGLKYAIATGIALFFVSSFMWSILRSLRKSLSTAN